MRTSWDEVDVRGTVKNGFDYNLQVWVKDYICQEVGFNAWRYKGQDIRMINEREERK